MDYSSKIVELSADVATIWRLQCRNLYNSKNLAALAVRECIQNSIDAISSAIKLGQIKPEDAAISIKTSGNDLIITDNGVGMDIQTLHEKFFNLGGTTKGDEDNVGGFGLAKAVILGCGTGFKVETQDNVCTSEDLGKNPIKKSTYFQGTRLTLFNVQTGKDTLISDNTSQFKSAVMDYVLSSDIKVKITINDEVYAPYFDTSSSKARRTPAEFGISSSMIPDKTKVRIWVFKDKSSYSCKYLYVRLRGLTQFKHYLGWNANCNIILDFDTNLDPRSVDYPFSTNREGLKAQFQGIVEAIRDKVSQSPLSISSNDEYIETLFDNANSNVESSRAIIASVSSESMFTVAKEVDKLNKTLIADGIIPQGGWMTPSVGDKINQYNEKMSELAKASGVSVQQLIKQMSPEQIKSLDNPLDYAWIIWEDSEKSYKKINKSKAPEYITIWDNILRLMASRYSELDGKVFYPGVVSKKDVLGLCVEKHIQDNFRTFIMFNPFEVPTDTDCQIALYLMNLAAHELAHFACSAYEAHGETWAYTREAIMNNNLTQLETVIKLVKIGKLRKVFTKMKDSGDSSKDSEDSDSDSRIDFSSMSFQELLDKATDLDIYVGPFKAMSIKNMPIARMRLVMAIKRQMTKLE